jgi:ferritin
LERAGQQGGPYTRGRRDGAFFRKQRNVTQRGERMKLTKPMIDAINEQINMEMYSSYLYLAMSQWCGRENLHGSAAWMRVQSQEETTHAMKLYDFMVERNAPVELKAIAAPTSKYKNLLAIFESALAHEEKVSASINRLYELAMKEKTFATAVQLQWFLTEQIEEEKNAREIVARVKVVLNDPVALFDLDAKLGERSAAAAAKPAAPGE